MHTPNRVRAVIFDFGNVLTEAPSQREVAALAGLCNLDRRRFEREYRGQRSEYDRGTIDGTEYWSRILRAGGVQPREEILGTLIREDAASWTRINREVLDWAIRLQEAGVKTGILSNMPPDILKTVVVRYPWIERFPYRIFSCEYGVIKPEPEIYRLCLEALGLPGPQVLFLDDGEENVAGARKAGMRALLFRSLQDVRREIAVRKLLPPHPAALPEVS